MIPRFILSALSSRRCFATVFLLLFGAGLSVAAPEPVKVTVTVIGLDGKPAAGVPIFVSSNNTNYGIQMFETKTNARGEVSFRPPCVLSVLPPTALGIGAGIFWTDGGTVRLSPTGTARGRIVDSSGKPVSGATVNVQFLNLYGPKNASTYLSFQKSFSDRWRATSASDGSFEISGLPYGDGDMTVSLNDTRFVLNWTRLSLPTNGATNGETPKPLVAYRKGVFKGRVIDSVTGKPVAGAAVHMVAHRIRNIAEVMELGYLSGTIFKTVSAADGSYTLPVDAYYGPNYDVVVRRTSPDMLGGEMMGVKVDREKTVTLPDLRVSPGVLLTGRLLDSETGLPLPEGTLHTDDSSQPSGVGLRDIPVNADGTFSVRVAPGWIRLAAYGPPGYLPKRKNPFVTDSRWVDISLTKSVSVQGILVDVNGAPAANRGIVVVQRTDLWEDAEDNNGWRRREATTDSQGHFTAPGLDPHSSVTVFSSPFQWPWADAVALPTPTTGPVRLILGHPFPSAPLVGRVVDTQGVPVSGVSVSIDLVVARGTSRLDVTLPTVATDAAGRIPTLMQVPRGRIASARITIFKRGWNYRSGGSVKVGEAGLSEDVFNRYLLTDIVVVRVPTVSKTTP